MSCWNFLRRVQWKGGRWGVQRGNWATSCCLLCNYLFILALYLKMYNKVVLQSCKNLKNVLYTIKNIMSLAKMLFSRHLNNMPIPGSLISWNENEKLLCILSAGKDSEKDTGITIFLVLVCGFPKCREGEPPPPSFLSPTCYKLRNCCR